MFSLRALSVTFLVCLFLPACQPTGTAFNSADLSASNITSTLTLTDHTGKPRQLHDFIGKVVIVFFGYTQCPDVCPTNMSRMRQVLDQLGDVGKNVQVIFVTLDPERDTRELLAQYVPAFHPEFLGLYGTPEQIAAVAKDFHVFYRKQAGSSTTSYTLDHSAGSYVFDTHGKLRLYLKHGDAPERIADDIRRLLKGE